MVAESAVLVAIGSSMASGLLKSVLEKCVDALSKTSTAAGLKSAILGSLKPQLLDLEEKLQKLDALLRSAESLNLLTQENRNELVLLWLKRVRKAANFAHNVLDEILYDQLKRQVENTNKVAKLGSSLKFRMTIGRKLNKFMSMSAKIYEEAVEIGLRPVELGNSSCYQPPAAMSTDLREIRENVDTSYLVGRQEDEDWIVEELSDPNNGQDLEVFALVGMSGVGKTTLARKIYDNETVREHYKKKAWIFVSDDFSLRRLLDEMLQSLTGVNHNLSNTDAMERKLQECLDKERYLLVLDDVWNTDRQIWDSIRTSLVRITDGCTGRLVLVTTQNQKVASVMGTYPPYLVKVLTEVDARALFEATAFANKSPQQVSDLRDIGEKILRKCGGLPLAINTLGSLLGSMDQRSDWESVERSEVWDLSTKIMPWLLLSFNHLPSASVKQCFAHCSFVIPKGGLIEGSILIDQWICQGFVQPSHAAGEEGIWAMGRYYITCMHANGLLQSNNQESFSMHDLIYDLALYVSRDTFLNLSDPNDLHKVSSGVEHVRVNGGNAWNSQLSFPKGNTQSMLRSLLCFDATISIDLVTQARFLRQLHLIDCGLKEVPDSIGRLKHLRLLQLCGNPFKNLPKSIGKLYNLRILALRRCHGLVELPHTVTKLLNLREVSTTEAVHIPKGMGQLTCLTRLPIVKLKAGDGCEIKELTSLLHLSGRVVIKQLENISCKEDAVVAGLIMKSGIEYLELDWTSKGQEDNRICSHDEEVMEGLQPHSNLEALRVENFHGKRFAPWLSNGLYCSNLRDLELIGCRRCEQLPTLGLLPSLKNLVVDGMESVEAMGSDFFYTCDQIVDASSSHNDMSKTKLFPQLVFFKLYNMQKLKEWFDPSGACASAFPCLEELYIVKCPLLVSVPSSFPSLKQLTFSGIHSGEPLLMILSNSYNLSLLIVEDVQRLTCLSEPLLKCTNLRLLRIHGCNELVELPPTLQSLPYLETLSVRDCDSLVSFPDIKGLLSLRFLDIVSCINITDIPSGLETCVFIERLYLVGSTKFTFIPDLSSLSRLRILGLSHFSKQMSVPGCLNHLSSLFELEIGHFNEELDKFCAINQFPKCLRILTLYGWPNLKSLPNELQFLTQLEKLFLWEFEGLIALPEWLCKLSSLRLLDITDCKNLKHLPSVDAMRSLTKLSQLQIESCPLLEERCRKERGEEWPKISHLSIIFINDIRVT